MNRETFEEYAKRNDWIAPLAFVRKGEKAQTVQYVTPAGVVVNVHFDEAGRVVGIINHSHWNL